MKQILIIMALWLTACTEPPKNNKPETPKPQRKWVVVDKVRTSNRYGSDETHTYFKSGRKIMVDYDKETFYNYSIGDTMLKND